MSNTKLAIKLVAKYTLFMGTTKDGTEVYLSKLDASRCAIMSIKEQIDEYSNFIIPSSYDYDIQTWRDRIADLELLIKTIENYEKTNK